MNARPSIVWDNHGCIPLRADDERFLPQLSRYRASGADVVSLNVGFDLTTIESNFRVLAHFRHWVKLHAVELSLISTVSDLRSVKSEGKLGIVFDLEGTRAIGTQLSLIDLYYDLGVRWMLMAYNQANLVGGGCHSEDGGLTAFGRQVIDEMARVGMVACCSHTGYRTARDVMAYTSKPVIFSHSNPRGMWNHGRNVPDDLIKACAQTGGVIGVNGVGPFLSKDGPGAEHIVAHIDYVVNLVGPEHVGLGLDYAFDQAEVDAFVRANPGTFRAEDGYAEGIQFAPPEVLPRIAERLRALGYPETAVAGIMGMNFVRVAEQVWR